MPGGRTTHGKTTHGQIQRIGLSATGHLGTKGMIHPHGQDGRHVSGKIHPHVQQEVQTKHPGMTMHRGTLMMHPGGGTKAEREI